VQDVRNPAEWRQHSGIGERLFSQVCIWIDLYSGQPLAGRFPEGREGLLALAKQVRDELQLLLEGLEPVEAMVLLCHLPSANQRGYSWQRLASRLNVDGRQLQEWEQQGYLKLLERISEQTPFLLFLSRQVQLQTDEQAGVDELESEASPSDRQEQQRWELLIAEASRDPYFDLRLHVSPALELAIRQAYHRAGAREREAVQTLFAKEDRWLVELVGARMSLERSGERGMNGNA
jgi:hypothetical protein